MPNIWTDKDSLDIVRELNALEFDRKWREEHIPTADRFKKVDGRYILEPCPHCERMGF